MYHCNNDEPRVGDPEYILLKLANNHDNYGEQKWRISVYNIGHWQWVP